MAAPTKGDTSIRITVNPEARVSATLLGSMSPILRCGSATDLPVTIVNQGNLTTALEVEIIDPPNWGHSVF